MLQHPVLRSRLYEITAAVVEQLRGGARLALLIGLVLDEVGQLPAFCVRRDPRRRPVRGAEGPRCCCRSTAELRSVKVETWLNANRPRSRSASHRTSPSREHVNDGDV